MARRLFSLLLAMTFVAGASTTTTAMTSSTTGGPTTSTAAMSSTVGGSTGSTAVMTPTAAGSTASTAVMSSTAAGSTASTAAMSSTAAGSTASTAVMSSTAAGSTDSTAVMSSTAAGSTASTAVMSSTAATTTAAMTTVAMLPLVSNSTVEVLSTNINNSGCSTTQLCASQPEDCNPEVAGSCFFVGTRRIAGQNFQFGLSGESAGYLGCTLSLDASLGGNDTTYICANNNGTLEFIGAFLNDGRLTRQTVNANSVRGRIDGNKIQCTFAATIPDSTARMEMTNLALAVITGNISSSGDLESPIARVLTQVVNLADPSSDTSNTLTTVAPTTIAASGRPTHQALSQALLIILGAMGLALL